MPDYFANIGAEVGSIRHDEVDSAIGVQGAPGYHQPIGEALRAGRTADGLAVFRLRVNKVELSGLYLCVGRRFIRLGDAAEVLPGGGLIETTATGPCHTRGWGPRRWGWG